MKKSKATSDERIERFAHNIMVSRLKQGLSQEQVAALARVALQTVCRAENFMHPPTFETALRISDALGEDIGDLCNKRYELDDCHYIVGKRLEKVNQKWAEIQRKRSG